MKISHSLSFPCQIYAFSRSFDAPSSSALHWCSLTSYLLNNFVQTFQTPFKTLRPWAADSYQKTPGAPESHSFASTASARWRPAFYAGSMSIPPFITSDFLSSSPLVSARICRPFSQLIPRIHWISSIRQCGRAPPWSNSSRESHHRESKTKQPNPPTVVPIIWSGIS